MISLRGSEGAKLNKAISHKAQAILMAEEQAVHVRRNLREVGGDRCHFPASIYFLVGGYNLQKQGSCQKINCFKHRIFSKLLQYNIQNIKQGGDIYSWSAISSIWWLMLMAAEKFINKMSEFLKWISKHFPNIYSFITAKTESHCKSAYAL